jgi:hypothetical protein
LEKAMKPLFALILGLLTASSLFAQEPKTDKTCAAVDKGLAWLVKQQRADGSFANPNGEPCTGHTAVAGLALLMEGSTTTDGKQAGHLCKVVDCLIKKSQRGGDYDGLIGDSDSKADAGRYMHGHGYAMLFLASVYADERDRDLRRELKDVLTRAVQFSMNARSTKGGWYYTSPMLTGHDGDESSLTLCQIQGLQAAHLAGIPGRAKESNIASGGADS